MRGPRQSLWMAIDNDKERPRYDDDHDLTYSGVPYGVPHHRRRPAVSTGYRIVVCSLLCRVAVVAPRYPGTLHNHCAKTPDGEATDRLAEESVTCSSYGIHPHGYPASVTRRSAWYARRWQYGSHPGRREFPDRWGRGHAGPADARAGYSSRAVARLIKESQAWRPIEPLRIFPWRSLWR